VELRLVAVSSAATAAAAPAAATTAAVATAPAAATTTRATALSFRTSFVDVKSSAADFLAVNGINRTITFRVIRHFDEGEPSRLARITIGDNVHSIYTAVRLKQRTDILFGRTETQVSNKNVLHLFSF
jgi:hypothetical protein